ncbi:unnamed protein product [Prunus armeniaca]
MTILAPIFPKKSSTRKQLGTWTLIHTKDALTLVKVVTGKASLVMRMVGLPICSYPPRGSKEILDLSYNLLSSELPLYLGSNNYIQKLDFSSNRFHGAIPFSFFQQARNLTSFNVSNNNFSGPIPSSICLKHSSPLTRLLDFSSNKFHGSISRGLGECSELQVFRTSHNNLSGFLPMDIYDATKLEELALPLNSIYGPISDRIVNLTNLPILDLSINQLSGVLPINIGKLSKLKLLTLGYNHLERCFAPIFNELHKPH